MNSVGGGYADISGSGAWEHDLAPGENSALIVPVAIRTHVNDVSVSAIDCDGEPLTYLASFSDGADCRIEVWELMSPPSGLHTITVTLSAGTRYWCANSIQMFDLDTGYPRSGSSSGDDDDMTADVNPADAGDIVIAFLMQQNTVTSATPEVGGIPLTLLATVAGAPANENCSLAVAYQRNVGAGVVTSTFHTDQSEDYAFLCMEFTKLPLYVTATAVIEMNAKLGTPRYVDGGGVAAAAGGNLDLLARVEALEKQVKPIRRNAWGS